MASTTSRRLFDDADDESSSSFSEGDGSSFSGSDESSLSCSDESSISEASDDGDNEKVSEVGKLAEREAISIRTWRKFVLVLVLSTAALAITFTFISVENENIEDFETLFKVAATTISDSTHVRARNYVKSLEGLSSEISTQSATSKSEFPFVTMPSFEVNAVTTREIGGGEYIIFAPWVEPEEVLPWNFYSVENRSWLGEESFGQGATRSDPIPPMLVDLKVNEEGGIIRIPYTGKENSRVAPMAPVWQLSPAFKTTHAINTDLFGSDGTQFSYLSFYEPLLQSKTLIVEPADFKDSPGFSPTINGHLHSRVVYPVFTSSTTKDEIVGMLVSNLPWGKFLANLLPEGVTGVYIVLQNTCGRPFTYLLDGPDAKYLGEGDLHDSHFNDYIFHVDLSAYLGGTTGQGEEACDFSLFVFPSRQFEAAYRSKLPRNLTSVVGCSFLLLIVIFMIYESFVDFKNKKIAKAAAKSNTIVSSLFPSNVRDRLYSESKENYAKSMERKGFQGQKRHLKTFISDNEDDESSCDGDDILFKTKPIAELFTDCTIMFADIVGFTAWSSVREPSQVFTLLETLYRGFDKIAQKRKVFKVETVGDCYVAVTGIPQPQADHALTMARFAHDCLQRMFVLTKKLEVVLGPDTGELSMRFGLHSGPVTAGVLRGDRSRFQLFGDTMNTASRMESTSVRGRIQLSEETANLIIDGGKDHWLAKREEKVIAKGKGEMETFWLQIGSSKATSSSGSVSIRSEDNLSAANDPTSIQLLPLENEKNARLIGWNVEVLGQLLKQIIARRQASDEFGTTTPYDSFRHKDPSSRALDLDKTVLDEVQEIITLPPYNADVVSQQQDPDSIELDEIVTNQLRELVCEISHLYRGNPFHNFEHASHVTMSVTKLLGRIIAPDVGNIDEDTADDHAHLLHDHTYGITSDPLTQFACVFSALIHDCDHVGVPNTRLLEENAALAELYKGKSIAEQNSVDLAWDVLSSDSYKELRATICATPQEQKRFRQLVVNSVMATDIMDKDLKQLRNGRWEKAFSGEEETDASVNVNRKATIVIEHLIQASDVAHTMQHWHVYRKWNERLFMEMSWAYHQGRSQSNPVDTWYKGEMGFFDFYIIPLAKKLKDCGVFGVSSDEYLNYAVTNRKEWESRGQEAVAEMVESFKAALEKNEKRASIK